MASPVPPGSPQGASSQTQSMKDQVKGEARGVLDDAKGAARAKLGEQQQTAATGVGDFARALREAARNAGDRDSLASRAAETAAERLERLSGSLKDKDLGSVVREAESFARREPMLFLGASVALGFVAMRLLKGAAPSTDEVQRRL